MCGTGMWWNTSSQDESKERKWKEESKIASWEIRNEKGRLADGKTAELLYENTREG